MYSKNCILGYGECVNCGDCQQEICCSYCGEDLFTQGEICLVLDDGEVYICESCIDKFKKPTFILYD